MALFTYLSAIAVLVRMNYVQAADVSSLPACLRLYIEPGDSVTIPKVPSLPVYLRLCDVYISADVKFSLPSLPDCLRLLRRMFRVPDVKSGAFPDYLSETAKPRRICPA